MSLATVAVLNSARKAMAQSERMAERRRTVQSLENSTGSVVEEVDAKSPEHVQMDVGPVKTGIGYDVTPKARNCLHTNYFALILCRMFPLLDTLTLLIP